MIREGTIFVAGVLIGGSFVGVFARHDEPPPRIVRLEDRPVSKRFVAPIPRVEPVETESPIPSPSPDPTPVHRFFPTPVPTYDETDVPIDQEIGSYDCGVSNGCMHYICHYKRHEACCGSHITVTIAGMATHLTRHPFDYRDDAYQTGDESCRSFDDPEPLPSVTPDPED